MILCGLCIYDMINNWAEFCWKWYWWSPCLAGLKRGHFLAKIALFWENVRVSKKGGLYEL